MMAFLNAIQIPWNVQSITFDWLKTFVVEIRLSNGVHWEVSSSVRTSLFWEQTSWWIQMWKCILVDSMKYPLLSRRYDCQISWKIVPTVRTNSHYKQFNFLSIFAWCRNIQIGVTHYSKCWKCIFISTLTRCAIQKPIFRIHGHKPNHIVGCN